MTLEKWKSMHMKGNFKSFLRYTIMLKYASSWKAQYSHLFTIMSTSFILRVTKLSEYFNYKHWLPGRKTIIFIHKQGSGGSQNGSYLTYWNSKADFIRGIIFPNDTTVSHATGVLCLYVPHLIRYMQIILTCIIHCIIIWT